LTKNRKQKEKNEIAKTEIETIQWRKRKSLWRDGMRNFYDPTVLRRKLKKTILFN
jgi:hypothetical protein